MPSYHVSWSIDLIDADTPEEAAQICHEMLLDPSNMATVFAVTDDDGTRTLVDLTEGTST